MSICVIPARGNSRRIPRKNVRLFLGQPIIKYSIDCAIESDLFSRIIVSTDDEKIFDMAEEMGAEGHMRDPAYGDDAVGTQEVMREVLESLRYRGDFACCIYATAPLMLPSDLRAGYSLLLANREPSFVFSVGTDPLRDAGQWYWGTTHAFLESEPLISERTIIFPLPEERVMDINSWQDWIIAETKYRCLK